MDANLTAALTNVVNTMTDAVKTGSNFAAAQLPDVLRQVLLLKLVDSILYCIIGLAIVVIGYKFGRLSFKKAVDSGDPGDSLWSGGVAISVCVVLFGIMVVLGNIFTPFEIIIAPKAFLLNYAADLLHSAK